MTKSDKAFLAIVLAVKFLSIKEIEATINGLVLLIQGSVIEKNEYYDKANFLEAKMLFWDNKSFWQSP
ncbi:MAG: hypothetical protein AAF215_12580 [Cyanobacteria bacterium P01_A01_bin.123]